jgi:crossover junction endodeoxyribonuclease RusA
VTKPIILVLDMPPSANVYWRTRVVKNRAMTYVSKEAKDFKAKTAAIVLESGCKEPIVGRVRVDLRMYPHRPQDWQRRQGKLGAQWDDTVRALDLDNTIKLTLDALKGQAFVDDVFVHEIVAKRMEPDEHGARVVVRVMAMQVVQPQMELEGGEA